MGRKQACGYAGGVIGSGVDAKIYHNARIPVVKTETTTFMANSTTQHEHASHSVFMPNLKNNLDASSNAMSFGGKHLSVDNSLPFPMNQNTAQASYSNNQISVQDSKEKNLSLSMSPQGEIIKTV